MVVRAGQAVVVTPFTLGAAMARFYGLPMRVCGQCSRRAGDVGNIQLGAVGHEHGLSRSGLA